MSSSSPDLTIVDSTESAQQIVDQTAQASSSDDNVIVQADSSASASDATVAASTDAAPVAGKKATKSKPQRKLINASGKPKSKSISRSDLAEVHTPVGRMRSWIKNRHARTACPRISEDAAVSMAAILDYMAADLLAMGAKQARKTKRNRITPQTLLTPMRDDPESFLLLGDHAIVPRGGVRRMIDPRYRMRSKRSKTRKNKEATASTSTKKSSKKRASSKKAKKSSTKKASKKRTTSKKSSKKSSTKKSSRK